MKLPSAVTLLAAASAISSVTAAPAADVALAVRSESDLAERTLFGGWCINLLGLLSIGNCGCWSQQNWYDYKSACNKWGYQPKAWHDGSGWKYQWGTEIIIDLDWKYYGGYWLPKDCNKWHFECPQPMGPKPGCPQPWIDGYHKACQKKGWAPHAWWDSSKNGYWFWFNGKFIFQLDFTLTSSGYCVPKSEAGGW